METSQSIPLASSQASEVLRAPKSAKQMKRKQGKSNTTASPRRKKSKAALPVDDLFEEPGGDLPFDDEELLSLEEYEALAFTGSLDPETLRENEADDADDTSEIEMRLAEEFAAAKALGSAKRNKGDSAVREKVRRRRQIDPTTCERDYTSDEVEFMNALDEYKRSSGRMFPTCSEVLEVLRGLGYEKQEKE